MAEWDAILERSGRHARHALYVVRNRPEDFKGIVRSYLHSKARRQLKRHPEKRGVDLSILYTAVYGVWRVPPHERMARKDVKEAVDAAIQQLISEGAVIRVDKNKVSPTVVNIRPGTRMLFNMAAPERSNVASALALCPVTREQKPELLRTA
jgi:hypothetical protein